jgi:hypothetical protein
LSRPISATLKAALHANRAGEGLLLLVTFSHASWGVRRFVANTKDVVSRGNTFTGWGIEGEFPDDLEGAVEVTLLMDARDRTFLDLVRAAGGTAPTAVIEAVKISAPDTVEVSAYFEFRGRDSSDTGTPTTGRVLQITMAHEPLGGDACPGVLFTPASDPDLWR